MKYLIIFLMMIVNVILCNAQGFEVQMRSESTAADIDVMLNKPNTSNVENRRSYDSEYNRPKYTPKQELEKPIDSWAGYWKIVLGINISTYETRLIGKNHYQILSVNQEPVGVGMFVTVETNDVGFITSIIVSTNAIPIDFQGLNTNLKKDLGYPEYIDDRMVWWGQYKVLSTKYNSVTEKGTIIFGYRF